MAKCWYGNRYTTDGGRNWISSVGGENWTPAQGDFRYLMQNAQTKCETDTADTITTVYGIITSNQDIWDAFRRLNNGVNPSRSDAEWLVKAGITTEAALRKYIAPWAGNLAGSAEVYTAAQTTDRATRKETTTDTFQKCARGSKYTIPESEKLFGGIIAMCNSGYTKIEGSNDCQCQYDTSGTLTSPGATKCADTDVACQIGKFTPYLIYAFAALVLITVLGMFRK